MSVSPCLEEQKLGQGLTNKSIFIFDVPISLLNKQQFLYPYHVPGAGFPSSQFLISYKKNVSKLCCDLTEC
jgi:hypothetical protein